MTFLPIVGRELRVAARRARLYWGRTGIAAATIIVAAAVFTFSVGLAPAQVGRTIFEWLAGIMLVYCLVYGRGATADCLSQEKREGTLGLLFLTDLKGYDVVLGKLAATSVRGFYALLAVFPVLAVPLLLGGVASGEFWRVVLVLIVTFLFSLAIGILGSALSRDQRRAMAANLNLLLLFVAIPPAGMAALAYFLPKLRPFPELLFSCPAYAFFLCDELKYQAQPSQFWWSVGVIHGLTWLLLLLAGWIVPRSWQDRPVLAKESAWRELWRTWRHGPPAGKTPFRKHALDRNAFYWLAARARFKPVHVWTVLGCIGLWWLVGRIIAGATWLEPAMSVVTALMLNFTLKVWLAIEAGQQLAEDRRSGAFELLLSVPLRVEDIVRGQLLALRRQFLLPTVAVLGAEFLLMQSALERGPRGDTRILWTAGMLMLVADLVALSWVGMWRALVTRSHNLATISTTLRVLVLPWVLYGLTLGCATVWYEVAQAKEFSVSERFCVGLWTGIGLFTNLLFGGIAWWQLRHRFRELALKPFNPLPSRLSRWFRPRQGRSAEPPMPPAANQTGSTQEAQTRDERPGSPGGKLSAPVGRRRMRVALACCVGVILVIVAYRILRPHPAFPPPVVVTLSQSNAPVRISASGHGILLIMPDGSLWQWGQMAPGINVPPVAPQRMGTNQDWTQAEGTYNHIVALRRDGTLWEWGSGARGGGQWADANTEPRQVDASRDWVSVAASTEHAVALRRDGTIWAWGDNSSGQLGVELSADTTRPAQVGTNNDWAAVSCPWSGTLALRRDGTLWAWGVLYIGMTGSMAANTVPSPLQVCAETNWTGFAAGSFSRWVRNSAGELWEPFYAPPNPRAPAAASMRLRLADAMSERVVTAWGGEPKLYELCPGGTIRQRRQPMSWFNNVPAGNWQPFGRRSDWTAIWSAGGAAFGLASDGTIWTWGVDLSRPGTPTLLSRAQMAYARLATVLGGRPTLRGAAGGPPNYLKEPRPLMRLVVTNGSPKAETGHP